MNVNENDWRYLKVLEYCEDNSKIGYVYIIQAETGEYKIGRSKNVPARMKLFTIKLPFDFEIIHYFPCDDMVEAEKFLHQTFASFHIRGEWFDIPPSVILLLRAMGYWVNSDFCRNERNKWLAFNRPVRYVPELRYI